MNRKNMGLVLASLAFQSVTLTACKDPPPPPAPVNGAPSGAKGGEKSCGGDKGCGADRAADKSKVAVPKASEPEKKGGLKSCGGANGCGAPK